MADVFESPLTEDGAPASPSVAGMAPIGDNNGLKKFLNSTPYQVRG